MALFSGKQAATPSILIRNGFSILSMGCQVIYYYYYIAAIDAENKRSLVFNTGSFLMALSSSPALLQFRPSRPQVLDPTTRGERS